MRLSLKNQTENFIQIIQKAHKVLGDAIDTCKLQTALQLLEECQAGAISLGTTMEELEGEGFVAVRMLEEYCELIYQIYEALTHNRFVDAKRICRELSDTMNRVWDKVKDEPVRQEVVFFPYKASMWDSLESVWKAAAEDPKCDVYVVPIPYYEKNPDGSFKEMHYEGDLYPDYVPITDWQQYDVEKRQPDVIYIHNPYDDSNYVTSVHPSFYAKRLRNFTRQLVYCPYFISAETVGEHYCTTPGVLYAHKVMLQSESIRKQYVEIYNASINNEEVFGILGRGEDKFVAFGSPKIDAIRMGKKEDYALPKEWADIIQNKKVVLYNTHLSELLDNGEACINKIKNVIEIFEKREDFVLWWRPHPLMEQTITSMRPQFRQQYQELIQMYKEKAIGIYDDTAHLQRAVLYSDCYYGSGGSLIPIYGSTGKPMMLQEKSILGDTFQGQKTNYQVFTMEGQKIYFISEEFNALVVYDRGSDEWEFLETLPFETWKGHYFCIKMFVVKEQLYIFPPGEPCIYKYDLIQRNFEKIHWYQGENPLKQLPRNAILVADVMEKDGQFVIIPFQAEDIITYETATGRIGIHSEWSRVLKEQYGIEKLENKSFRLKSLCTMDKHFYVSFLGKEEVGDVLCSFSLPEIQLEKVYTQLSKGAFLRICNQGNTLWIIKDFGKYFLSFDTGRGVENIIANPYYDSSKAKSDTLFWFLVNNEEKVFAVPRQENVVLELQDDKVIKRDFAHEQMSEYYDQSSVRDGSIYVINKKHNTLCQMDEQGCVIKETILKYPLKDREKFRKAYISGKLDMYKRDDRIKFLLETPIMNIEEFFTYVATEKEDDICRKERARKYEKLFDLSDISAGSRIHTYVMEQLED